MIKTQEEGPLNTKVAHPHSESDKVPLRFYKEILLAYIKLAAVLTMICIGIAYLVSSLITPIYSVTTTIMVKKENLQQSDRYDTIKIGESFARTYTELITSDLVLNEVKSRIKANISVTDLREAITTINASESNFVEIRVEYSDPELALLIADNLVEVFIVNADLERVQAAANRDAVFKTQMGEIQAEISQLEKDLQSRSLSLHSQRIENINTSIDDIRAQIEQINQEISTLQTRSVLTPSQRLELNNKESLKNELFSLLLQYQDNLISLQVTGPILDERDFSSSQISTLLQQHRMEYLSLQQDYQDLKMFEMQNITTITQIDHPVLPEEPLRPNLKINLVMGFISGLVLAAAYIFKTKLD